MRRNADDGLALEQIWWRANLYRKTQDFMVALRDAIRTQPDNSTAIAFYAKAALEWRTGIINETSKDVPDHLERSFGLSIPSIRAILDRARQLNPQNWVGFLTEPEIKRFTGGRYPPTLDKVDYSKRALQISDNPWTNVAFANALMEDAAFYPAKNPKGQAARAVALLKRSRRRFPNYPRTDAALFQFYAYWPLTKNSEEAHKAEQRLIASINPSLRQTAPIQRYLSSLHLK